MPFQKGHKPVGGFQKGHAPFGAAIKHRFGPQKSITQIIDECPSGTIDEVIDFLFKVAKNTLPDPVSDDPNSRLFIPLRDRIDAGKWLAERRHGKAPLSIDVTSHDGGPAENEIDYGLLSDTELAQLEHLHEVAAQRRLAALEPVDGTIMREVRSLPEGKENETDAELDS